jgi:hypothetical protein
VFCHSCPITHTQSGSREFAWYDAPHGGTKNAVLSLAQYTDAEAALYAAFLGTKLTEFKYAMYEVMEHLAPEHRDTVLRSVPCSYSASTILMDAMKRVGIYDDQQSLIENEHRAQQYLFPQQRFLA